MKEKIMATLMASIMVVVALAAFVAPAQAADDREGSATNPKYIIGGASDVYELGTEQYVEASIDFNYNAYDSLSTPVFTVSVDGAAAVAIGSYTGGSVTFTTTKVNDSEYTVKVTAGNTADTASKKYVINMALVDTVWGGTDATHARTVALDYNYAMNIKVVSAATSKVVLYDGTADVSDTALDIQLGKEFSGPSARMLVNGSYLDYTKYDFYTTGLPAGIYMKSTGEIAGKVIWNEAPTTSAKTFNVYAVDVTTGTKLFDEDFTYTVSYASDSFMYEIDTGAETHTYVPYSTVGYTAVKNYDTGKIKVNVADADEDPIDLTASDNSNYVIKYTVSDNTGAITKTLPTDNRKNGYFEVPITEFADYTGVVEITIEDTTNGYKAIIHTMVVGPVVHSGLAPAVTSA